MTWQSRESSLCSRALTRQAGSLTQELISGHTPRELKYDSFRSLEGLGGADLTSNTKLATKAEAQVRFYQTTEKAQSCTNRSNAMLRESKIYRRCSQILGTDRADHAVLQANQRERRLNDVFGH